MTPQSLQTWRKSRRDPSTGRRWTQQDAADALGLTRRTYQRMEAGDTEPGRLVALAVSALSLGIPPWGEKAS